MKNQRTPGRGVRAALAALATGAMVAGLAAVGAAPAVAAEQTPSAVNGYRNVGYFAQWGVYGRDFKAKQLQTSGTAADLTHINYAFGNINYQTLECFIANKAQGTGPNGSDGAGDAWADFGMGYTAANSVAGTADTWDQPLAGSFNQMKQLKAKNPNLKVMISLGGWTWSKNFSKAAATDASRKKFVKSCVDLYLRGNLPVIDGRGGPGAAAGVFDGIDIDWEWPGSQNGEVGNHVDEVNDKANFTALLKEFRTQIDALTAENGHPYQLSAFLPANPADIAAGGWNDPENFKYLDFGNVQGYDLHGAWNPTLTGHQANLFDDPADTRAAHQRFSVDKAVKEYLKTGISPKQLGIGLAAYGRGWQGATSADAWGPATAAGPGTWEKGNEDYDKLKTLGTEYYDPAIGAAWRYDGNQWWSYDNAQSTTRKGQYIAELGLGGGMWWELDGDRNGELIGTLADKLRASATGPATDPVYDGGGGGDGGGGDGGGDGACTAPAWNSTAVYTGGAKVSHEGSEYTAQWWTQGGVPGSDSAWKLVGACEPGGGDGGDGGDGGGETAPAWNATTAYTGGQVVSHEGASYRAKWWTQGDEPGASAWGPWELQ
ncbi:glycosyl hydrolase family 18 protein [Agromyces italicus]|uniref:glycosyl hydrolase family 18 protein n=1 Tax=Agromyces italicus TaxID=279572 RepID=UPI00040A8EB9|nr:glycosyl hydrolase family 18 protein [Agromyces italicus]